jgi:hypothetical protein
MVWHWYTFIDLLHQVQKSLKILKGNQKSVNRKRTDNAMKEQWSTKQHTKTYNWTKRIHTPLDFIKVYVTSVSLVG